MKAYKLTNDIDENDIPFIALTIELDVKLWSGDKALKEGLLKKGQNLMISTPDLKTILNK